MIKTEQIADPDAEKFFYITATTEPQMETLLKQGVIQMELFTEKLCEIASDGIRYIMSGNPVRANEIHDSRNRKLGKIRKITDDRNTYLSDHPKADVLGFLTKGVLDSINKKVRNLGNFVAHIGQRQINESIEWSRNNRGIVKQILEKGGKSITVPPSAFPKGCKLHTSKNEAYSGIESTVDFLKELANSYK